MTGEEKKLQNGTSTNEATVATTQQTTTAPMSYGGSYDSQINDLYQSITNRQPFSYDVNGDALYQQYKDQYVNDAKRSMKDTIGQTSALTGGYGNSYGSVAGQQQYDRTMEGLTSMIPELQQNAYSQWQDQGNALNTQYSMLTDLAAQEQNALSNNYSQLSSLILNTGYNPTEDEIAKSGMNADQVTALRQKWIASNPQTAYAQGAITADEYYKLTGSYPAGYSVPSYGGGYYGGGGGGDDKSTLTASNVSQMMSKGGLSGDQVVQTVKNAGGSSADVAAAQKYVSQIYSAKEAVRKGYF